MLNRGSTVNYYGYKRNKDIWDIARLDKLRKLRNNFKNNTCGNSLDLKFYNYVYHTAH